MSIEFEMPTWPNTGELVRIGDMFEAGQSTDEVEALLFGRNGWEIVPKSNVATSRFFLNRCRKVDIDTQEQINNDITKDTCDYWNPNKIDTSSCTGCPKIHTDCTNEKFLDLLRRQRELDARTASEGVL